MHFDLTIKAKLFLFFSLILLIVGGVFAYLAIDSVRLQWAESEMLEKYELAKTESEDISRWIEIELKVANRLADSVKFGGDYKVVAQELKKASGLVSGIGTDPHILAMSRNCTIIYQEDATDWDQASLAMVEEVGLSLRKSRARPLASSPFYVYARGTRFLLIIPKRDMDGKFDGTFNLLLNYGDARIGKDTLSSTLSSGWHVVCKDSVRSYGSRLGNLGTLWGIWRRTPASFRSKDGGYFVRRDGTACSYARIPHTDSYVMIFDKIPGLDAALKSLERLHLGFGLIALLLVLSSSIFISSTLVRPIQALKKGVNSLRDDAFTRIDTRATGEMRELIASFNEMGQLLQKSRTELRALSDFSSAIILDVRDENVCERVAVAVAAAFEVEAVIISLVEDEDLVPRATVGIEDELTDSFRIRIGDGLLGTIFKYGSSIIENDLPNDARVKYVGLVQRQHFRKFAGVPLLIQGKPIGVLAILNPRDGRDFNKSDLYLLSTFAGHAAIKIRNHDMFRELEDDMQRIQQLQSGLMHSEKLAAVGQLVSGVAHELNNPLGIMLGYAHLASKRSTDPTMADYAGRIEAAAERAAGIVKNLLTFARKKEVRFEKINLNEVVRSVCDLAHPQFLANNLILSLNLDEALPATMADFQQLQEVFLNLVTNAIHSMEGKGRGKLVISTFQEEGSVVVTVADDGEGIAPEILPKIFEPFFTTKPVGKGTGLGLSLCYGIIKQHGGEISVQSLPGKGSIFTVEIPVRDVLSSRETGLAPGRVERLTNCRILVVEDEPAMGALMKESLEGYGCAVETAADGKEALRILENDGFGIIISDLRMPGMDGREFYQRCISRYPVYKGRFIFISGDTASEQAHAFLRDSGCEVLLKPFPFSLLAEKIVKIRELADSSCMQARQDRPPAER